ncbi:MAG: urate oxidase [Chloroflexi bacterium]|nr:urate oxidase [Chloroflexota bacterium]
MTHEIHYGKADVSTYRTYATPLRGLRPVAGSAFTGRENVIMAADLEVRVLGGSFWPAYTKGDNSLVVATDTMKNFIHRESLAFDGSTLEGWLFFVGRRFLETYPHMERLEMSGRESPFHPAQVPTANGEGTEDSTVLFHRGHGARATVWLALDRSAKGDVTVTHHKCAREGLQMMKVSGSAFADFQRDEYTTLPERKDRPLYIHCDIGWKYQDPMVAIRPDTAAYVAPEQVGDVASTVFHQFVSLSIQHLLHEMATRMLSCWPQLAEVSFDAENRLWDLAHTSERDERVKVYTDPRPPFGRLGLVLRR